MAKAYLNDTTLQAIANAIRTQTNTTATLLPSDMPAAISMIGGSTLSTLEETGSSLRYWPGWDKASWVDIKFIMDEYGMNRRPLPKDIKVGVRKLFKIGD